MGTDSERGISALALARLASTGVTAVAGGAATGLINGDFEIHFSR